MAPWRSLIKGRGNMKDTYNKATFCEKMLNDVSREDTLLIKGNDTLLWYHCFTTPGHLISLPLTVATLVHPRRSRRGLRRAVSVRSVSSGQEPRLDRARQPLGSDAVQGVLEMMPTIGLSSTMLHQEQQLRKERKPEGVRTRRKHRGG